MKFNVSEIAALLHVHEKAMGHPKLKPIADQAMAELEAMLPKAPEPLAVAEPEPETKDESKPEDKAPGEVVSEPEEKPEHE